MAAGLGRDQAMTDHDIEGKNWLEVAGAGNITVHTRALPLACPLAYFYHQLADTAPWLPSPFNNISQNFHPPIIFHKFIWLMVASSVVDCGVGALSPPGSHHRLKLSFLNLAPLGRRPVQRKLFLHRNLAATSSQLCTAPLLQTDMVKSKVSM